MAQGQLLSHQFQCEGRSRPFLGSAKLNENTISIFLTQISKNCFFGYLLENGDLGLIFIRLCLITWVYGFIYFHFDSWWKDDGISHFRMAWNFIYLCCHDSNIGVLVELQLNFEEEFKAMIEAPSFTSAHVYTEHFSISYSEKIKSELPRDWRRWWWGAT